MMLHAVMNAHPLSANAIDDTALQKTRAFACRSRRAHSAKPPRIFGEALLIGFKLLPGDIADMRIGNHELPFRLRNLHRAVPSVWQKASTESPIDECASITRIVQHLKDSSVCRPDPMQLGLIHSFANPAGKQQTLVVESLRGLN